MRDMFCLFSCLALVISLLLHKVWRSRVAVVLVSPVLAATAAAVFAAAALPSDPQTPIFSGLAFAGGIALTALYWYGVPMLRRVEKRLVPPSGRMPDEPPQNP